MIIQVIIRLVLYVDQWVLRTDMQYGLIDGQLTFITKIVSHYTFTFLDDDYGKLCIFLFIQLD